MSDSGDNGIDRSIPSPRCDVCNDLPSGCRHCRMKPRITVTMLVDRDPHSNCAGPGEGCACPTVERERTVEGTIDERGRVELLFLWDSEGSRISLGELSIQEQDRAREMIEDAAAKGASDAHA